MIITSKEDFDKLPQDIQNDLMYTWHDGDTWDLSEEMECYHDPEYPFVEYSRMTTWEVDMWPSRTNVSPVLDLHLPAALCWWYHELWATQERTKGEPSLEFQILKNHYWMFFGLSVNYIYIKWEDGYLEEQDVDWFALAHRSPRMETFTQSFFEFLEASAEGWKSNLESSLSKSYEYVFSEERVIENLIANEVEVEYDKNTSR